MGEWFVGAPLIYLGLCLSGEDCSGSFAPMSQQLLPVQLDWGECILGTSIFRLL